MPIYRVKKYNFERIEPGKLERKRGLRRMSDRDKKTIIINLDSESIAVSGIVSLIVAAKEAGMDWDKLIQESEASYYESQFGDDPEAS